jgi:phage gp36-like protein
VAWITPAPDDILGVLSAPERSAYQTAAAGTGQIDRLASAMKRAIGLVRGRVGACERFRGYIGPLGTIPDELYSAFFAMTRFYLLDSLPVGGLITAQRQLDYEKAIEDLAAVARGEIEIAAGSDPSGQPPMTVGAYGGDKSFPINPVHRHPWWDTF